MAQLVDTVWQAVGTMTNKWSILVLTALFLFFWFGLFRPRVKSYKPARTFDGRAEGFWPSQVHSILSEFTPVQLQTYLNQARGIDMFFPIIYSLLAAMVIRHAAPFLTFRWLILLPFATALFDYIENLSVMTLIGRFRANKPFGALPVVLVVAQRAKIFLMGAVGVVVVLLTVGWVRRRFS
jgi:hypothetical protein